LNKNRDRDSQPTWRIIDACVPRGTSEKLARSLSRSAELINRWKRPPEDDENPAGTGALSPLDVVEAIQDHAFAHAPDQAHRIHLYFQKRFEKFTSAFAPRTLSAVERDQEIADVVREHSELLQAILQKMPPDSVRAEWEQLKREGEELVRMIECQTATDVAVGDNIRRVK
jgi:hypothetical protein